VTKDIIISDTDFNTIDKLLSELVKSTGSRCALLLDKSGHLILAKGHFHFIPPDDMAVMAAGAFSALSNMVDIAASHLTTYFHFPGTETVHFAVVTPEIFLLMLYKVSDNKLREKEEEVLKSSQKFIRKIKPVLGKKVINNKGWESLDFINEKINQIFMADD
jgi:roadblock/LC7 domain-containing protein